MRNNAGRSAAERRQQKEIEQSLIIVSLVVVIIALILVIDYKMNPPKTELDLVKDDVITNFVDSIGVDKEDLTGVVKTESGATLEGNLAKTVKQYRTLAEAEEAMGYYLGLHNTIESHPEYNLVAMYNIGDGAWYQALFEHSEASRITEELGDAITEHEAAHLAEEYPSLTVKTTKDTEAGLDGLIAPYLDDFNSDEIITINDVKVRICSNYEGEALLGCFTIPNKKSYSIYTSYGIEPEVMKDILGELINNLKIMEDWED